MARIPEIPGYVIEKDLGEGGMARVYLAREEKLDRLVALKVLALLTDQGRELGQRFMREARTAARLSHSHIVAIHDVGELDGRVFYMAMEFLGGGNLNEKIRQGSLRPEWALEIFVAVASALDYAHQKGFIHRDVKPDNILFREDGTPVLCDFGIARAVGSATRLTKTGMSVGTPHYMSPEQARGRKLDGRSDLYSLGVVLYEMLTGKVPFEAEDSVAVAIAHVQDPVPRLPEQLQKYQPLLDKLLAKDPEQRPQTGKEAAHLAKNLPSAEPEKSAAAESSSVESQAPFTPPPGRVTRRVEEPDFQSTQKKSSASSPHVTDGDEHAPRRLKPVWILVGALVVLLGILGIKLVTDASSRAEQAVWQQAQSANTVTAYAGYLRKYPQGEYADKARSRQKSLRDTEEASRRRQQAMEKSQREQEAAYAGSSTAASSSSLGIEWVRVPAGEFSMGSNEYSDEKPVHRVYLDTYYISKYEVTFDQYDAFCNATGCSRPSDSGWGRGSRPVINVSWDEAVAFCRWLSGKRGKTVRLPTEAEWEKAAKGGNSSRGYTYSGSNNVDAVAWYSGNAGGRIHPVGQKSANELGLHDMSGNVWEWCADWYDADYYSRSPARNPTGPSSGSGRVGRGGGWSSNASFCRSAIRFLNLPSYRVFNLGFRPVMEP
ncbi:MAG: bifunctional serine/threonine-protein kinase/formylglycine-generating enzyme family protein [Acidobacteriota bacterium]|jgi:formylglycine-generating enzyme required for sulfatase activity|nr:bifunctional serine/threonine-protein kinase/formylglycine-generating enzyme family protein [Acidobacteriota bacterium]